MTPPHYMRRKRGRGEMNGGAGGEEEEERGGGGEGRREEDACRPNCRPQRTDAFGLLLQSIPARLRATMPAKQMLRRTAHRDAT